LYLNVIKSDDTNRVGMKGIIVKETKNTFEIISNDKIRKIPKKGSIFKVKVGRSSYKLIGDHLILRPYERSKKDLKFYYKRLA